MSPRQDRIIIGRLDSICQTVLKGRWPLSSEHSDSPGPLVATSCATNSVAQHQQPVYLPSRVSACVQGQVKVEQPSPEQRLSLPALTSLPKVRTSTVAGCCLKYADRVGRGG